jgi:rRNA-processing protein EBP2
MARGGKLKAALNAHKGIDFGLEKQKKLQKLAAKRKGAQADQKLEESASVEDEGVEIDDINVESDEDSFSEAEQVRQRPRRSNTS